jgi:hypothetical protein
MPCISLSTYKRPSLSFWKPKQEPTSYLIFNPSFTPLSSTRISPHHYVTKHNLKLAVFCETSTSIVISHTSGPSRLPTRIRNSSLPESPPPTYEAEFEAHHRWIKENIFFEEVKTVSASQQEAIDRRNQLIDEDRRSNQAFTRFGV